jgi:hypothetical protein
MVLTIKNVPSPLDSSKEIELRVDTDIVGKLALIRSTIRLWQVYYNVCGRVPPVNNIGYHEKDSGVHDKSKGILDVHAVFQGLNRPHETENGNEAVYIYIIAPDYRYDYAAGMVCVAKRNSFPDGTVFAVYVHLDADEEKGVIFNWEPVKSASDNPRLPENFNERYDEEKWVK